MQRIFVGITGASGHRYAEALIRGLVAAQVGVDLSVTSAGRLVLAHELGVQTLEDGRLEDVVLDAWLGSGASQLVRSFAGADVAAPPSSGTAGTGATVICPCSMGTLARVAVGFSSNLVERAADVALKEGRKLVLVPRETPMSAIHLENLLRLARLGATILPAALGFYHRPETVDDLVQHVIGKLLDIVGVEHGGRRWSGVDEPPAEPGVEPRDPA